MKKIITISFLLIYLLNLAGNSLYLEFLISKHERTLLAKIDDGNYEQDQLVEIKIPVRTPYYSSSARYERFYGEINIEGHNYSYVQRKILNDTVYLTCLPDYTKNKLEHAKTALNAGLDHNAPGTKKNNGPIEKKQSFQNEYDQYWSVIKIASIINSNTIPAVVKNEKLPAAFKEAPVKPPSANNPYYS